MPNTSLVNSIIGNWSSILPLILPIADAGAGIVGNENPGKAIKIAANLTIKVFPPLYSFFNDVRDAGCFLHCFKPASVANINKRLSLLPDLDSYDYQKKRFYLIYGFFQLALNIISFVFDCLKYYSPRYYDPYDKSSEIFNNISLFTIGLGLAVITIRELQFKKDAEAEDAERASLAAGLAAALARVQNLGDELARPKPNPVKRLMQSVEVVLEKAGVPPRVAQAAIQGIPLTSPTEPLPKVKAFLIAALALLPASRESEIIEIAIDGHSYRRNVGISALGELQHFVPSPQPLRFFDGSVIIKVPTEPISISSLPTYRPRTRLF